MKSDYPSFVLGKSLVVPNSLLDSLTILNPTARLIWERLSDCPNPKSVANELAFHFNIPQKRAMQDVESIFHLWNSREFPATIQPSIDNEELPDQIDLEQDKQDLSRRTYALSNVIFRIDFYSVEMEAIMQAVLGHLEHPESRAYDHSFEVLIDRTEYCLKKNDIEVGREKNPHRLRHELVYEIAKSSYPDSEWLVFLHAGAISDDKHCILLPGNPFCGKSTLTASLTLEGLHYICEDIAPIARRSWSVCPVQTRICLREGGWRVLSQQHPGIKSVQGGRRWRKQLRYLTPPKALKQSQFSVHCIVFPEYIPDQTFQFTPISSEDKLTRLIQTGAWFGDSLNQEWIEELLEWIESTPGYQLRYQNTQEAVDAIRNLLAHE
jgi:hypothetical protein